jgi:hypothetical protein
MHIKRTDTDTYGKLPVLNVITWRPVVVPEPIKDIVFIHNKVLTPEEYDEILLECGVCICLSKAEGFGHAVNEAMASGCNLIVSGIPPFLEDLVGIDVRAHFTRGDNKPNEECFGNIFSTDMHSLVDILENFTDLTFKQKQESSELIRQKYETRHNEWVERMKSIIPPVFVEDVPVDMPKEEDLPNVSIICITRDRRIFMPVLNYSYMIQSYPEEKMELIVVDDGDDPVEDCFFGVPNVVYVRLD